MDALRGEIPTPGMSEKRREKIGHCSENAQDGILLLAIQSALSIRSRCEGKVGTSPFVMVPLRRNWRSRDRKEALWVP